MFELILIRHGQTDGNLRKVLMGRQPVPLNVEGKKEVRDLAHALKEIPFHSIYVSPSQRALQTSQLIMRGREDVAVVVEERLDEIDYGDWVGKGINDLPDGWQDYFARPSQFKIPGGEAVADAQKRAVAAVEGVRSKLPDQRVVMISHADVIKLILVHYLEISMDEMQRFKIDTASVSVIHFAEEGAARLVALNSYHDWKRYCVGVKVDL